MPISWKVNSKSYSVYLCFFVFLAMLLIAALLTFKSEQRSIRQEHERALHVVSDAAQKIKFTVDTGLAGTYMLEALLKQGNGEIASFEAVAARMQELYPGLFTILLMPGGAVGKIAPSDGNEMVLDHSQFEDSGRLYEPVRSLQGLTLLGPVMLKQDQMAIIGRLPIYLGDPGAQTFWGFVSVTFKFPDVLFSAQLNALEAQGYGYKLWRIMPGTQQRQTLVASTVGALGQPLERRIDLPNASWVLSIEPLHGWGGTSSIVAKMLMGLLASVLAAFLVKLLLDAMLHKQELERLAFLDVVTGLPNRRLLLDRLGKEIAYTKRHGSVLAVAFIDLDGFKAINDDYGHDVGDQLLHTIATRMQELLRESDTVARIGGDEFVVVTSGWSSQASCTRLIDRLLACISEPVHIGPLVLQVSGSIGLAFYRKNDIADADELLRQADQAMYHAKVSGKNRCQIFTPPVTA